ncbi:Lrp/AsnC family transcriptional regulator [Pseudaminobacter sp. NGMCC 1.201702]|uniref:Lrp/AsnC family transcriptional regulator n=1 Tax=Pseudaminobacter sp. NGMCC 1.201702 TaxID=3391825 RepID=UPI0039F1377C
MKLDPIDLRILDAVQRDGRITKQALADEIGLPPAQSWMRLSKLERAGIVTGYHARVSTRHVAPVATILMEVSLGAHRQCDFERFERAVGDIPEIVACWIVGGEVDYVLKIVTQDIAAYQRLVDALLERELGIDRYSTYVVIRTVKDEGVLPLETLLPQTAS